MSRVIATLKGGLELCAGESFAAWKGCFDDQGAEARAGGQALSGRRNESARKRRIREGLTLRKIDGWQKIVAVLSQHTAVAT